METCASNIQNILTKEVSDLKSFINFNNALKDIINMFKNYTFHNDSNLINLINYYSF